MVTVEAPNRRSDDRFRFSPAYTRVVVIPSARSAGGSATRSAVSQIIEDLDLSGFDDGLGTPEGGLEGHGYDISSTGMRFELDEALAAGTEVAIELYPPAEQLPIRIRGTVVRVFSSDDDPGPRRMAVQFTGFDCPKDRERLDRRIEARACCWPE
jgi:hypothetical protein